MIHMVLRLKNGLSLDTIHEAFACHGFDVKKTMTDFTPNDLLNHARVEPKRRETVEFVVNHAGISAIHPELNPDEWP